MQAPSDYTHTEVGSRIRELRDASGMTGQELADALGVCRSFVGDLETNRTVPSLKRLISISKALGCSPLRLLEGAKR